MKKKMKQWLGTLLSIALILGLIPGMSLTAYADDQKAYAAYDVTTDVNKTKDGDALTALQVKFNEKSWYIIADNSTAENAGTVTLLAAESFGLSEFHDSGNAYSTSMIRTTLDNMTVSGSFAGVASAINTVKVKGSDSDTEVDAKLYLLSTTEASNVPEKVRKFSDHWWLRSPGNEADKAAFVYYDVDGTNDGIVWADGFYVTYQFVVRPALQLNLSSVIFSSESKEFSLKLAATVTKAPTAKSLIYNGSAQELVTAGEATGGTMYYAVTTENAPPTDENLYTTSIPTATDAGTYYVWYRADGDSNHESTSPEFIKVTIAGENGNISGSDNNSSGQSNSSDNNSSQSNSSNSNSSQNNGSENGESTVPGSNDNGSQSGSGNESGSGNSGSSDSGSSENGTVSETTDNTQQESSETVDNKQKNATLSKPKAGKKSITVKWKKQTAKGIKGYEIQCSTDKKFKKDVKTVTINKAKTTSKTIKKLKSKKKYYVRIRTFKKSGSDKIYSKWSKAKSVKVK